MKHVQILNVAPCIPESIRFLETLARNAWWSWNQDAIRLMSRIDPGLWRECGQPLEFLRRVPQHSLEALAGDTAFIRQLRALEAHFRESTAPDPAPPHGPVAYFSLEFGIHESIRLYSGGLGVLAGDHLKAASDCSVPLTGVGLFYHQGYFEQRLNADGWQQEHYPDAEISNLPMRRARDRDGRLVEVRVPLPEGQLSARVWDLRVGGICLLLLDTNVAANRPEWRNLTARLYGGDQEMRLRQELLLAIGGFRALLACGIEPDVCHLNEGHAAFLSLARIEHLMRNRGLDLDTAREVVSRTNVFTTHTPVAAGNETFPVEMVLRHLAALEPETGIPPERVIEWGRAPGDTGSPLSMTILGLRFAHLSNAVSRLHGDVARGMWQHVWPSHCRDELPIRHVTNGVHAPTWLSPEIAALLQQFIGLNWEETISTPKGAALIDEIPDEELWRAHEIARSRLIRTAREALERQMMNRNATRAELHAARTILDPDILTIGFARRAAAYKRATLVLRDPERLEAIINSADRPVQFIFAGKSHPADHEGKDLLRQVVQFARNPAVSRRFLFLENYDMRIARALVQGADVWLNTPRRRVEASGTSGMKAAMNGVLNASILDGWWDEGYTPEAGWAIGAGEEFQDPSYADHVESNALYRLLEDDIIPSYYHRPGATEPGAWIRMMKASLRMALTQFTSRRMVREYQDRFYVPASTSYRTLMASDGAAARGLSAQRVRFDAVWGQIRVLPPVASKDLASIHAGDTFEVTLAAFLGDINPEEVTVQLCMGPADAQNQINSPTFTPMEFVRSRGDGWHDYRIPVNCPTTGRFGITARVLPADPFWHADSPGYITWAEGNGHTP